MTAGAFTADRGGAPAARAAIDPARRRTLGALALIAPLFLFLAVNFIGPIAVMLANSVRDHEVAAAWPQTARALRGWDGRGLPDEATVRGFVSELETSREGGSLSAAANRLNYDVAGLRGLVFATSRALPLATDRPALAALAGVDPRWARRDTWMTLKRAAGPATSFYFLASVDRRLDARGRVVTVPADRAVFVDVFVRTFAISAVTALICLLLGYPLAYLLANTPPRISNPLMILVLLPFWTSVLVRTTAWAVILQRNGLVNGALRALHLTHDPLQLIYNRTGVYVAMVHVLLPFLVLPLYGVMKGVSPHAMRAALSLGAPPPVAFWRAYLPQTMPGIVAGSLIVFILALGYYVTPALVGGAGDQMISWFIAFYTNQSLNWGMAAALSVLLLAVTLALTAVVLRLAGRRELEWR